MKIIKSLAFYVFLVMIIDFTYGFNVFSPFKTNRNCIQRSTFILKSFEQSYVTQKNHILLDKLQKAENLTDAANQFVNFCDESFDNFIQSQISELQTEPEKQVLGKVRYEINSARQRKLREADKILRGILSAGGLKQMEAKLMYHLKKSEIDMAFMVILELNIEDAYRADSTVAAQVMTHLRTMITDYQDKLVTPPVRLLRMLVRTDDINRRKKMLRKRLKIDAQLKLEYYASNPESNNASCETGGCSSSSANSCSSSSSSSSSNTTPVTAESTEMSAGLDMKKSDMEQLAAGQCEHIVIEEVTPKSSSTATSTTTTTTSASHEHHSHDHSHEHSHDHTHNNNMEYELEDTSDDSDVEVQDLVDTIDDVIAQMSDNSIEENSRNEMIQRCEGLKRDLQDVLDDFKYYEIKDTVKSSSSSSSVKDMSSTITK